MWFAHFIIYYTLILSFIFFAGKKQSIFRNKLFIYLYSIPLIILSALRYARPGCDTAIYLFWFGEICQGNNSLYEPGFNLLLKAISLITTNGRIMLLIINLIFFTLFFRFILKYSCCIWLSVFLFIGMEIFDQSMNLVRQLLALAIIVNSFDFLITKRYIKFCLIIILASTFHFTAITFLVAPFLQMIKLTQTKVLIYYTIIPILFILSSSVLTFIMSELNIYSNYLNSSAFGIVEQPKLACILHLLINIMIFSFCYFFGKKEKKSDINILMTKFLMVGGIFWALSVNFSTIGRAALYFDAFSIVLIPNILYSLKIKTNTTIIITILLVMFITKYFVIAYMRPEWFAIYPYEFYFEH